MAGFEAGTGQVPTNEKIEKKVDPARFINERLILAGPRRGFVVLVPDPDGWEIVSWESLLWMWWEVETNKTAVAKFMFGADDHEQFRVTVINKTTWESKTFETSDILVHSDK